jgi:hypothetical protein
MRNTNMLTADTITDDQIRELWEYCIRTGRHLMLETASTALTSKRKSAKREARARCAEILNARAAKAGCR